MSYPWPPIGTPMRCTFDRRRPRRIVLWALFLVYTAWLLWLLLFRRLDSASAQALPGYAAAHLQLFPLATVTEQLAQLARGSRGAWVNLAGNVALFVPEGILLPALFRPLRKGRRCLLGFAGAVILVELLQLLLRVGACDVDDLLLNSLGAGLGFAGWKKISCKGKEPDGM